MSPPARLALSALGLTLVLGGCSTAAVGRVENGVFISPKGYRVKLPRDGWRVEPGSAADLELKRNTPKLGMLVHATCEGHEVDRPLPVLARHLTFGLKPRETVEQDTRDVNGRPAAHSVVRGSLDGVEVAVEAIVVKGSRCVHDFLYVAPTPEFESGRRDFDALVGSFSEEPR